MGHIDPTKEVFAQFRANDRPGPIHMLNLVRLREWAAYPDGRKATGAEAYAAYGRDSGPVFERLGGRIVWQGRFELMLIGPQEERWDHAFIAEYPSVAAFAEMIRDPVYREAVKHRQAAVEDSRLIRHYVLQRTRLLHHVLARQVVAALLERVDQELGGGVAIGVEVRILVAFRIVL